MYIKITVRAPTMFKWEKFTSHSGKSLQWKIDCDDLSDDDIECIANIIHNQLNLRFCKVYGIPSGGVRLAAALQKYCSQTSSWTLIVDDVLTTGNSMINARQELIKRGERPVEGVVIFSRGPCPPWIIPIFTVTIADGHLSQQDAML
jgi:orotate phosphoribosyltransferase